MTATDATAPYIDALGRVRHSLPGENSAWLRAARERALTRFAERGFPTTRDERWKYTNVAPVLRHPFTPAMRPPGVARASVEARLWDLPAHRLVFVNGYYAPELSDVGVLPAGAGAGGLAAALTKQPEAIEPYLGLVGPADHGFAALNGAFLADGAYVHLARGVVVALPIHLVFLAVGAGSLIQPRTLIVAEPESRALVIEHYLALGEERYLTNAVTELVSAADTEIEHYRIQQESANAFHIGSLHIRQEYRSRFTSHAVDIGGLLVRNEVRSVLNESATCTLNGLYVADGRSHIDNHTEIDHAEPDGTSRECYKGVLNGRARAVFNGRVVVRPDAQRTDAQQMNKNLLLSEDAEVDTKPELEIYADDVKCSHGATVGSLDQDALFYLRSRAVDEAAARDLLTYAFAHDILRRMRLAPVRTHLERRLSTRLFGGRAAKELESL